MDQGIIIAAISCGRTCIGLLTRPYETYRRIVDKGRMEELVIIAGILCGYFLFAALIKASSLAPILLTQQFIVLVAGAAATFLLAVGLFWRVGIWMGGKGKMYAFAVGWGYTLIPTVLWFFITSLLYVVLPPPRTTSTQGVIFSITFLIFSATMLFWKITLSYLALRFGLRISLGKILLTSSIVLPIMGIYSYGMYKIGIFRVPFI